MVITFYVKFEAEIPTTYRVLDSLKEHTGLDNIEFRTNGNRTHIVYHPYFESPVFSLLFDDESKEIIVWLRQNKINYLLEATLYSLIYNLGGRYDWKFNDYAKFKWSEVSNLYQDRKIISNNM